MEYLKALGLVGGYETSPYDLVKSCENGIEERIYPAQKWSVTETITDKDTMDRTQSDLFFTLFGYISGKNETNTKIAMTVPVSTKVQPLEDNKEKYSMGFYLPKEFQQNPPVPTDPRVKIVTRDLHVYTITFGGKAKEKDFMTKYDQLLAYLKEKNVKPVLADDSKEPIHYFVGYDAPFKLWNRRNEVWVQVE